jgi:oxygen-dependent protoporphyrinogen oxidase
MTETKTAIIGGGISGLCAAYYLAKHNGADSVIVLESSDHAGGHLRTDQVDGFSLDWGPNGFLDREPLTLAWVDDLGLTPQLIRANENAAHRFILINGALHEVKLPPAFLFSPILSLFGRVRLLFEPFIRKRKVDTPESIYDFAARRIGHEAAEMLVSPMVTGIFGGDAKKLSVDDCFPRMRAMEREHGSLFKAMRAKRRDSKSGSPMGPGGTLTTFAGGAEVLATAAEKRLKKSIRLGTSAVTISKEGSQYKIGTTDPANDILCQQVVLASPAFETAGILSDLAPDEAGILSSTIYAPIAVVCTAYPKSKVRHDMNGFGFLVPRNQGKRVLGCIWTSSIFPSQAKEGYVLLRSMFGGATDPDAASLSERELLDTLKREVHPLLGIGTDPELVRIYRHRRGIPQYTMNHGRMLDATESVEHAFPGLVFAGNAYRGVGLNDCVVSAHRAVKHLCTWL